MIEGRASGTHRNFACFSSCNERPKSQSAIEACSLKEWGSDSRSVDYNTYTYFDYFLDSDVAKC